MHGGEVVARSYGNHYIFLLHVVLIKFLIHAANLNLQVSFIFRFELTSVCHIRVLAAVVKKD